MAEGGSMASGELLLGEVGGGEPEEPGISGNLVVLLATIVMSWNWITLDLFREESFVRISTSLPPWPPAPCCQPLCPTRPTAASGGASAPRQPSTPVLHTSAPTRA